MNPTVPSIGVIAERWSRRASQASPDYQSGVEKTGRDWAQAALASEGAYKAGVTAAAGAGRFGKGVTRAGTAKWRKRAAEVGPARYSQGVQVATPEFSSGFAPYAEAISRIDLPPRGPRGSSQNYGRVMPIGQALNALKNRT